MNSVRADFIRQIAQLIQMGQLDTAEKTLKYYCSQNKQDAKAWSLLSTVLGRQGKPEELLKAADQALVIDPNEIDAIVNSANAYGMQQNLKASTDYFNRALLLKPNEPSIQTNLAAAFLNCGEAESAITTLNTTLHHSPDFYPALATLGSLLYERQQFQAAEHHLKKAHLLNEGDVSITARLALSIAKQNRLDEARPLLEAAIQNDPDNTELLYTLSISYISFGQTQKAIESLEHARTINPNNPRILCALANTFSYVPDLDKSLALYNSALEIDNTALPALEGKAEILRRLGKLGDCYDIIKPFLRTNIASAGIANVYASICHKYGHLEEAITLLKRVLSDPATHHYQAISAHFSLGKLLDSASRFDEAFSHYSKANSSLNYQYQKGADNEFVTSLLSFFNESRYQSLQRSNCESARPIFIVGMPRSGTTLLEQILDRHTDICGGGELPDIGKIINEFCTSSKYPENLSHLNSIQLDSIATRYLRSLHAIDKDHKHVTDKMPVNHRHLPLISLLFPNAKIIHCTRNRMDCCLSNYFQQFSSSYPWSTSLSDVAHYHSLYERCMNHWSRTLGLHIYEIAYEEVISSPEATIRSLLSHLGLEWQKECLNHHESTRQVATASIDQVKEPIYQRSVNRWKHYADHLTALVDQ